MINENTEVSNGFKSEIDDLSEQNESFKRRLVAEES